MFLLCPLLPACLNHRLFKASDFISLLNTLLYSVVFVLTSWKEPADFFGIFISCTLLFSSSVFNPLPKCRCVIAASSSRHLLFSSPFLFLIPNYNLYVPLLTYSIRYGPCKNEYFVFNICFLPRKVLLGLSCICVLNTFKSKDLKYS